MSSQRILYGAMLAAFNVIAGNQSASAQHAADFGKMWVRTHPFTLGALTQTPEMVNGAAYKAANFSTFLAWKRPETLLPIAVGQNLPWHFHVNETVLTQDVMNEVTTSFNNNPGNTGWLIHDEPRRLEMPGVAQIADWVKQQMPGALVYTNSLPMGADATEYYGNNSNPGYGYSDYLNDTVSIVKPDVMMYDLYPFSPGDSGVSGFYYTNMMAVRNTAKANNKPYWAWIQSFEKLDKPNDRRLPSESDLRFQMFSHLTAGYKGFHYFGWDPGFKGLVDLNGNLTSLYPHVAPANAEVSALGNVLRFLDNTDIRYVPNIGNPTPAIMQNWSLNAGGDSLIKAVNVDTSFANSTGAWKDGLIGFFTDDNGERFFMMTNAYHGENLSAASTLLHFEIRLDNSINHVLRLNPLTGLTEAVYADASNVLRLAIPGGTGMLFKYDTGVGFGAGTWKINGSGDWNQATNWTGMVPNVSGMTATFAGAIRSPRTVYTEVPISVSGLTFNNPSTYVLTGAGSLTLQIATGSVPVNVLQGNHKINLPLIVASNTNVTVAGGATLTLGNPVTIKAGKSLTHSGNLLIKAPLSLEAGASMVSAAGTVTLSSVPLLGAGAAIDLQANSMVVDYSGQPNPAATIEAQLTTGAWNGDGIMTTSANAETALGWVQDSANQRIMIDYTYRGDANLNGLVESTDFNALVAAFGMTSGSIWASGDFNYDDKISTLDFNHLAGNFGKIHLPDAVLGATVPEPALLTMMAIGMMPAFVRGIRKRS